MALKNSQAKKSHNHLIIVRIFSLLLMISLLLTFLVACKTGDSNTPTTDNTVTPTNEELIEERIKTFLTAYNTGDMDAVLKCLDAKTRNAFQAMLNLLGGIAGSYAGFDIDLSDLFSLGVNTTSGDFMGLEITSIDIINETTAVATTNMELSGTSMTIYFDMVYENDGWYISDMTDQKTGNSNNNSNQTGGNNTTSPDNKPTTYQLKTYSSTDEYGNAGTYTEINDQYSAGETVELEATVNSGYNFVGWFINGTCVSEDLKYTYTTKSNKVNIEARWSCYTVDTYSDSDDYEKAGTYTELKGKKISIGEQVTVEATVNTGYNFVGWFINGTCVSEDLKYTFTMKNKDVNLEARWSYYTVSVYSNTDEQGTAGTFTKKTDEKIRVGETVTLTATVNKGFNFEGWYVDGNLVSSDFEYSFTMQDRSAYVEAVYSYYSITVESWSDEQGMAGTYPKKDNEKISAGEVVTLTATVADGYNFEGWYIDGVCVCSDLTYQFIMEKTNKTINAEYSYYTITTNAYLNKWSGNYQFVEVMGSYTKYDCEKISNGQEIKLVATVGDGYTFKGWYINDVCVCDELEYTYTMTKENVEIVALYTYYTISTEAYLDCGGWGDSFEENMGTYTQYYEKKIRVGETVTLTATTKPGYRFLGWKHWDTIICEDLTYTFVMGTSDETYVAVFEEI